MSNIYAHARTRMTHAVANTRRLSRRRLKIDRGTIKYNRVGEVSRVCVIIVDRFMLDGIVVRTIETRARIAHGEIVPPLIGGADRTRCRPVSARH
jgi:hypothetical protein